MKKTQLFLGLILPLGLYGQSVVVVPNTEQYGENGIVYDNSLFFSKNSKLVKFDGGTVATIPEPLYNNQPINGILSGSMVIYNNKLCYNYDYKVSGATNEWQNKDFLITYDGVQQNAFLNPESVYSAGGIYIGGSGHQREPILYNGKLVLIGSYYTGLTSHLYTFDGQNILKINNVNNNNFPGAVLQLGNQATIYNNDLYFGYKDNNMFFQGIGKFNGTTIQEVTNSSQEYLGGLVNFNTGMYCYLHSIMQPESYGLGVYNSGVFSPISVPQTRFPATTKPLIFNSKMYYTTNIMGPSYQRQLISFDGTNVQKIDNITSTDSGPVGVIITFGNDIYMQYEGVGGKRFLGKYTPGDTGLSIISNLSLGDKGIGSNFKEFNGSLYFTYKTSAASSGTVPSYLAKYDGTSITVFPNPDSGEGVMDTNFVVYGNDLYFPYKNEAGIVVLAKYGTTVLNTKEEVKNKNTNLSVYKDGKGFSVISKIKEIANVELMDASGKMVSHEKVNNLKYSFELNTTGIFIIKVTLKDGDIFTHKIRN